MSEIYENDLFFSVVIVVVKTSSILGWNSG